MRQRILFLVFSVSLLYSVSFSQSGQPDYKNSSLPVEKRVKDLLGRMTIQEKIDLIGGDEFATKANKRLGIPDLRMTDGPVGVRWGDATAFPVSIAMAATWNPDLVYGIGGSIGREVRGKGRHVILGPCVNIVRLPMGGRNFESFGEDPFLTSRMAVAYIKGVQSENAAATIKHFAVNNQEYERMFVDVMISRRALNEIYLPAFKAAVQEADPLCFMSSYNKVNFYYASENDYLLKEMLKGEWGFKGLVMSDWGAVHSSLPTAKGGLDLEMPTGKYMNQKTLMPAIESGELSRQVIDDKISRILSVIFRLGLFDKETPGNKPLVGSAENLKSAYETSRASIVLLKNENNILPLQPDKIKTLAIIGPAAAIARTGGGGSSYVSAINPVTPLDALKNRLKGKVNIEYREGITFDNDQNGIESDFFFIDKAGTKPGLNAEYFSNKGLSGAPAITRTEKRLSFAWGDSGPSDKVGNDNFSARWTGYLKAPKSGKYTIKPATDDGMRFWFEDKQVIEDWTDHGTMAKSFNVTLEEGKLYKFKFEYYENSGGAEAFLNWIMPGEDLVLKAVDVAKKADCVLIFAGTSKQFESEGFDREDLALPEGLDQLIEKIADVNKNVVVVLSTGAPVTMGNWLGRVNGVTEMWFGGSEGGNAIADVLLGNYNPSGKLPVTFPKRWEDCSAYNTYKELPARTYYSDDIYVGYRHFDKKQIEPLFPFGYGLSYTSFSYENLKVYPANDGYEASLDIKNTGSVKGEETAQLYIAPPKSHVDRSVKELKGFSKIELNPGESKNVIIKFGKDAGAYYDEETQTWKTEPGSYEVQVGSSSRDVRLKGNTSIK